MTLLALVLAVSLLCVQGKDASGPVGNKSPKVLESRDGNGRAGGGVIALTPDTLRAEAAGGEPLLVYYYTNWCKHCESTAPVYAALADELRERADLELTVAKLNVEEHLDLAKEEGLAGFPTIRIYRDGRSADFHGERSVETLLRWLERKMGVGVKKVMTRKEARRFIDSEPIVAVGFFKDATSEAAAMFKSLSGDLDKFAFAMAIGDELLAEYEVEDGTVTVFKQFDEGRVDVPLRPTVDTLRRLVKRAARPLVIDYRVEDSHELFGMSENVNRSVLVAFLSRRAGHYDQLHDVMRSLALDHAVNVSFVTVNADLEENKVVWDAFRLKNVTKLPAVRLFSFAKQETYAPQTDTVSADAIREFIARFHSGALDRNSVDSKEETPVQSVEKGVVVLMTSTFDKEVYDGRRHALVLFYTDSCSACVAYKPIYEQLAQHFASEPSLYVTKIDMAKNSAKKAGVELRGVPVVALYPQCGKRPVLLEGLRNFEELVKFVREHTGLEVSGPSRHKNSAKSSADREEL